MDNDTLKRLFKAGAIILVLDAPPNQLEFGIDVNCWNTGPRFKGIKIIPPGPHFVYYSLHNTKATEPDSENADIVKETVEVTDGGTTGGDVRVGFWHLFESGEVVVMKWNAYNEEMELEKDQEQIARYKAGIQEFDPFLGAYPLLPPSSTYPAWLKLANHIKKPTIETVFHADGFVNSHDDQLEAELARAEKIIHRQQEADKRNTEAEGAPIQPRTTTTIQEEVEEHVTESDQDSQPVENELHALGQKVNETETQLVTNMKGASVAFTPINLRSSFRKGAIGEEVTRYSLDKSWLLNDLFTTTYKSDVSAYLGEYQTAFVTMLLAYHLGAFRQWKSMTILACQSTEAITSPNYTRFFSEFIQTLHNQLASIPSSFFMDLLFASPDEDDMTANFLELTLKTMGRSIQSGFRRGQCSELRRPMRELQKTVLESFEWKIPGDFKKVEKLVEITPDVEMVSDEDDDYEEEGEYAPVVVE
ncbi:a1-alpha2 repression [Mortierella polycephala]|uniref:A1-alpha2 repression n=1 Tax=Mortierella polycephala TaxID=41804 RepID=A0A9P6U9Z8_9FUNG|nr:a1-alpha2 repression [Mortierella polycephala]